MLKIIEKIKTNIKRFRKFNSIYDLDKKMLNYLNYNNGYYIECGAYDGVNQSNTWYFEKKLNWKGILIEPNPEKYEKLRSYRNKKNIFVNAALVEKDYFDKEIKIFEKGLGSATYNEKLFKNKYFDQYKDLPFYKIKALNLTDILLENNAPKLIDFFSLDVEGYEEYVFKGIDFDKFNFKYILVETQNSNAKKILEENHYELINILSPSPDLLFKYKF